MSIDDFNLDLEELVLPQIDEISLPNINSNHGETIDDTYILNINENHGEPIESSQSNTNLDYFELNYGEYDKHKNIKKNNDKLKDEIELLLLSKKNLEKIQQDKESELEKAYILINFLKDVINTIQIKHFK